MPTYANSRLTTSNFARQRPRLYLLLFSKDPSKAGKTASLFNWLGHIILDTSRYTIPCTTHTHIDKWPKLSVAVHGWWSIIARQPPKPPLSRHPGEKQPTHRKQFGIQKEGIRKVRSTLINDQPRVKSKNTQTTLTHTAHTRQILQEPQGPIESQRLYGLAIPSGMGQCWRLRHC